ncbi:hypothetical protein N7486_010854 [Penicillium sp. IBT 16267x]|nr:hypothetical protein N7486_010854 [Penicillium sp. IBT 16267x]
MRRNRPRLRPKDKQRRQFSRHQRQCRNLPRRMRAERPQDRLRLPASWTITQGAETASFTGKYIATTSGESTSYDVTVTEAWDCKLKSSTESASCTMSIGMSGSVDGTKYELSTSSKATYSPIDQYYYKLTVTAGLSSFTMPAATETGAAAGPAGAMITAAPVVAAAIAALL